LSRPVLQIENLSKQYRLGEIGTGTLSRDLNRWWARIRGKEDPYLKIGEVNDRSIRGISDYVWALKDINFEVEQGEVLGVIGKNGAGKSTLLKILSKVTGPTTGIIRARGRIASLLEVGTGFHPDLTGRENIYLNGTILGMTRREVARKLDEIVDFAGVARYLDTPVKRYSSGMKVRLGFAVAAHLEPDILIVDEGLAVGDAEFQQRAIGKMREVSSEGGRTVLFVSHNMGSIRALCDRTLVVEKGRIAFDGPSDEAVGFYLRGNHEHTRLKPADFETDTLVVREVQLFSGGARTNGTVVSGEPLELSIQYAYSGEEPLDLVVRLLLESAEIGTVSVCSNYHSGQSFYSSPKEGIVSCVIDRFPFRHGTYSLSLRVLNQLRKVYENHHALSFRVIEGDFYQTGRFPRVRSQIHLQQNWKVRAVP